MKYWRSYWNNPKQDKFSTPKDSQSSLAFEQSLLFFLTISLRSGSAWQSDIIVLIDILSSNGNSMKNMIKGSIFHLDSFLGLKLTDEILIGGPFFFLVESFYEVFDQQFHLRLLLYVIDVILFSVNRQNSCVFKGFEPFLLSFVNFSEIVQRDPFFSLSISLFNSLETELRRAPQVDHSP